MPTLSSSDRIQLRAYGLTTRDIDAQLARLRRPPLPVRLARPCTVGNGIERLKPDTIPRLLDVGAASAAAGRVTKFVPASGAATRMFQALLRARAGSGRPSESAGAGEFFERLDEFPFGAELRRTAGVPGRPATEVEEREVLAALFDRMRYAELPKALIPFHRADRISTALEEHLLEGMGYVCDALGTCRFHFTVSPEFRRDFESTPERLSRLIEARRPGALLQVTLSEQHASTDTVAIDGDGNLVRTNDGALLFRPAGHGALLRNLEELGADFVVIKNIDNVLPIEATDEVVRWKRLLIGHLAEVEAAVFERMAACTRPGCPDEVVDEALAFASVRFGRMMPAGLDSGARLAFARVALDRPIRIAGVVRNSGEPGGAPFWVTDREGTTSIQIVESSQVDLRDSAQNEIFKRSTHFNPVDLVCAMRNWRGEPHQLDQFVDEDSSFVARKTFEGRAVTVLERPGLWNGAMAGWNTICVEVPEATFAPVKTVFDLLRPEHQSAKPRTGGRLD